MQASIIPTEPSLPRNFVANPRDPNSVQLTWDEPSDTGCK